MAVTAEPVVDPGHVEPVVAPGYVDQDRERAEHIDEGRERPWGDRVRWGPLWAGLITTLAMFTLLQLVFVATKAVDIDLGSGDASFSFWAAVAALTAFFVGGLVTGASTKWDRIDDGVFQGVLLWALATVALLVLGGVSARALAGPLGGFLNSYAGAGAIPAGPQRDAALDAAQKRAAQALLSLFLALVAAVGGAVAGSKLWPRSHNVVPGRARARWGTRRA